MENSKRYPPHPARDAFIKLLERLYDDCGIDTYSQLIAMSERLRDIYPDMHEFRLLTPLSKTALSEVLHRKRKGLPRFAWVATYVLSCQQIAYKLGILAKDPGLSVLPEWHGYLREAEEEAEKLGLFLRYRPGRQAGQSRRYEDSTLFVEPAPQHTGAVPVSLASAQKAVIRGYGPYGRRLVGRLALGDRNAAHQAALFLAPDFALAEDVVALLTDAAARVQRQAVELLQASPQCLDRRLARDQACQLARRALDCGSYDAALAFIKCLNRFDEADRKADPRVVPGPMPQDRPRSAP